MRRLLLVSVLLVAGLTVPTTAHAAAPVVWVFGHSIPAGDGPYPPSHSWPNRYAALTGSTVRVFALGGAMLARGPGQGVSEVSEQVRGALAQYPSEVPDRVFMDAGTNDTVGYDELGPVAWAVIGVDLMLQERGMHGTWMTILPMGYGTSHPDWWVPILTTRAHRYNDWLRAMAAGGAFDVADMAGVLHEDPDGIMRSTGYFLSDGLHPDDQGALLVAGSLP